MKRVVWTVVAAVCLGGVGAQGKEKQEERQWTGVEGAGPVTLRSPQGCYLYKDYVVLAKSAKEMGEDLVVKDRRKLPAKATPAQLCADDGQAVVLRRPADGPDFFAGIYRNYLLIDSGTSAGARGLAAVPLAGGKTPEGVGYLAHGRVYARGPALYFQDYIEVKGAQCKPAILENDMKPEACERRAHEMWKCIQQEAGGRLDAVDDPFDDPRAFNRENMDGTCQIEILERRRWSLEDFKVTPTTQVRASVFFAAVG